MTLYQETVRGRKSSLPVGAISTQTPERRLLVVNLPTSLTLCQEAQLWDNTRWQMIGGRGIYGTG
jgi:hypothetical protein